MSIFTTIYAGDSDSWTDDAFTQNEVSYSSATHTLTYELRGPSALTLTASANGSGWKTTLTTSASDSLMPGTYAWAAYVSATNVRVTAGMGTLTVLPNLASQSVGYDPRSDAEKALAACEAAIATGAQVVEYRVGDRMVRKSDRSEILAEISYWKAIVLREQAALAAAEGLGNPRVYRVRMP